MKPVYIGRSAMTDPYWEPVIQESIYIGEGIWEQINKEIIMTPTELTFKVLTDKTIPTKI